MSSAALGQAYLIPCYLDPDNLRPIPPYVLDAVKECQVFFVENERSARRYLKKLWKEMVIDDYQWYAMDKNTVEPLVVGESFRRLLQRGHTIGIISEAGCPGVADPGQDLVAIAHRMGARVLPLSGPSSILLALMGSGLNGQQFRFNGYLPIDAAERVRALKDLEQESQRRECTQIFIETPYRNRQLMETICGHCRPETRLCVAADLTGSAETIRTKTIGEWKSNLPDLHKRPVIFLLQA
jgi:16S rRNA (cytidine1402-2'-O)-methyltransferase